MTQRAHELKILLVVCMGILLYCLFIWEDSGKILFVEPYGWDLPCTRTEPCGLEVALQRSMPGDTVQFFPGIYLSSLKTLSDGVTFRGAPGHTSILLALEESDAIIVDHDNITISGFLIDGTDELLNSRYVHPDRL